MSIEVGDILEGKVAGIMPFGAFVSLPDGESGLVHISEVASVYVEKIEDFLKQGDSVKVKVLKIDDKGKISLSIKKAAPPKRENSRMRSKKIENSGERVRPADVSLFGRRTSGDMSFEDKMSRFKQDSDEKMQALKRSADSKRSGGYRRGGGSY
jgi:S1 RNA binding domain protein